MADEERASTMAESDQGDAPEELASIPLIEERLSVSKRPIESGRVRVHVTVDERQETVTQELQHDELQIDRIPKNVRLTEVPRVRLEGNTTIVPVVEEVVVVEKAMMLVEEIHICRRTRAEVRETPVTLRSERATVEREPAVQPTEAAE